MGVRGAVGAGSVEGGRVEDGGVGDEYPAVTIGAQPEDGIVV